MINKRIAVRILLIFLLALLIGSWAASSAANASDQTGQGIWQDVEEASIAPGEARQIVPNKYRTLSADMVALDGLLASAPPENTANRTDAVLLSLPLPDGTFGRFLIQEYAMMEPELAAQFPEITTYLGQGVDDPAATIHLDRTPAGFHGMILSNGYTVYIDPYSPGDSNHYISYFKEDFDPGVKSLAEEMSPDDPDAASRLPDVSESVLPPSGSQLRTYRAAVAATGEYTQFHGGTVNAGMAAIVTSMNRVTGIYERDVAVRMILVANNNLIVYTNPNTDPYNNNNGGVMLGQNQTNLDSVIGSANYDIGHVFSTNGGGVAFLGVVCSGGNKARGVTGTSQPVGDPFDVDYVAHEMGHQFGANHTFNGTTSSCGGGNRNGSTAYEPGSGATIMAYAGICGAENLQPNSDAMFHVASFDEIVAYTTVGNGNTCPVITNTGNTPPTVNAGSDFTIPEDTPFTLTGSATDPNGDSLTYSWEQFDLGAASPPNTDNGNRPIFRTFLPVPDPSRTFPKLSDILNNISTIGESLPTTNRTLHFRMVVRDNRVGGGGVDYDTANVTVTTSSGPFLVTSPNTAVTWPGNSAQTVTWNVANTTAAPVSCSAVNILLSTDGGNTFPTTLVSGASNDGSQVINVPNVSANAARVKVECAGNIFFDISNANFTITTGGPTSTPTTTATPTATGTAPATPTVTSTPAPGGTMHVGDLDGSSFIHGNRWDATVVITVHDASENPVSNATVDGTWSNGSNGSDSCVTDSSGQCSIIRTDIRGNRPSVTFTVDNVTHASNAYQPASNHDPDGDSDGTSIIIPKVGSPGPTPTPTSSPTPGPGGTIHVGDLDGSGTTPQGNMWVVTVVITVHTAGEAPVAGATVTGSWNAGPGGSDTCVTDSAGQCSISKTLRANITSVSFTVNNVSATGATYNAGDNHDPDSSSDGTTILITQ